MNAQWIRAALVGLVAFGSAGVTWAVTRSSTDDDVSACVKKNGEVRVIVPGFTKDECDKEGKRIHFPIAPPVNAALRVVDGQKRDLGRFVSIEQPLLQSSGGVSEEWVIESYNEQLKLIVLYSSRGSVGSLTPLGFTGENCTGMAFTSDPVAPVLFGTFVNGSVAAPYYRPASGSLGPQQGVSTRNIIGECSNQAFSGNGYRMDAVTLPFEPVVPFELSE